MTQKEAVERDIANAEAAGAAYLAWVQANKSLGQKDSSVAFFAFIAGWTLSDSYRAQAEHSKKPKRI